MNKIYILKQTYQSNGIWKIYLKYQYNGMYYRYHKGRITFTGKCWIIYLKKYWKEWNNLSKEHKLYLSSPWISKSIIIKKKKDYVDGINGWYLKNSKREQKQEIKEKIKIYKKEIKKFKKKLNNI